MMQRGEVRISEPATGVLCDIAWVLESAESPKQRLRHALLMLERLVPYDRCALLVAPTLGSPLFIARPENGGSDQSNQANVRRVLEQLLAMLAHDATMDIANLWPGATAPGLWKSHLAVPLIGLDRPVGVLVIGRNEPETQDQDGLSLLSLVAAQIAAYSTALEKRELKKSRALRREQAALAVVEERNTELREMDQAKDEFIATASHDLKSPLTSISGYAQLLRRRLANPTPDLAVVLEGLDVIIDQVAAMTRLLDDLLDASRIQAGALELRPAPCDLVECLDTIFRRFSPEERGRIELRVPDAPLVGDWDKKRIEDALGNLLRNALKYSGENERVAVTLEQRGGEVEVAVTDSGMGITPEELPQLFQRFHRTRRARASGLPGIGLGLYICNGIIAHHGGRIWAESPGEAQGATFRFVLPVEPGR